MSIEAMKQALAKFERLWEIGIDAEYKVELLPEIEALRQAIEQAEKPTRNAADFLAEKQGAFRDPRVLIMEFYKPEKEPWDTSDMAHRSGGLSVEQAEKQEPVAWLEPEWGEKICPEVGYEATMTEDHPRNLCWIPLYTAPPRKEWVGLTDEEIKDILDCGRGGLVDIRKAEQILRERNT